MPRKNSATDKSLEELVRAVRLVVFDFDGVFTDNMVYVSQDGTEMVRCFRGDGLGLSKLKSAGIETLIISTEANPVVSQRSRKLGIRCVQECKDKLAALKLATKEIGVSLEEVAFVGNDFNDLECLTGVGLPIVVQDAQPEVIPIARYRTSLPGGHGAVREVCDLFERVLAGRKK